ncbi:hypothetical protein FRC04_000736 [Tulasnella sp. 424]|nr:hypothetical protein FRC04_000736 [Tulasnella sp. 424]
MLSLRAFIAIIAATSLSSNVVAQTPVPNWGLCGGLCFGANYVDQPCAGGWVCTVENAYYHQCLPPPATTSSK